MWTREDLLELIHCKLQGYGFILVSHSEPYREVNQRVADAVLEEAGIDWIDYTRGICERFRAIDRFLGKNPEYRERLVFVQIAVPSRSRIANYRLLGEQIENLAEEVNLKWASETWRPIVLIKEMVPHSRLVALHRLADFCLITSLHDGMNLVATEYVASSAQADAPTLVAGRAR
jgi:trehalose-6-phosphate synthase